MIQVNELRVGNWVRLGEYSDVQVKVISEDVPNDFSPIHLTPDILGKAGFRQARKPNEDYYSFSPFAIKVAEDRNIFILSGGDSYNIKSLHQLQNLYFALTGQELIINL